MGSEVPWKVKSIDGVHRISQSHAQVALAIEVSVTGLLLDLSELPFSRLQKVQPILQGHSQNKASRQSLPFCAQKLSGIFLWFCV